MTPEDLTKIVADRLEGMNGDYPDYPIITIGSVATDNDKPDCIHIVRSVDCYIRIVFRSNEVRIWMNLGGYLAPYCKIPFADPDLFAKIETLVYGSK